MAKAAIMLEAMAGLYPSGPESSRNSVLKYISHLKEGIKGKTIGIHKKPYDEEIHPDTQKVMYDAHRIKKDLGGTLDEVEVKYMRSKFMLDLLN